VKIGKPATLLLIEPLRSGNNDMCYNATKVLGEIKDGRAVPGLINVLLHNDWRVRAAAASALGEIKDPRAVPALIKVMLDEDRAVRGDAEKALLKIGNFAVSEFIRALGDDNLDTRKVAVKILDNLGWQPSDLTNKVNYLFTKEDWKSLEEIGLPAVEILVKALKDENKYVRRAAAMILGKRKDARAVEVLVEILNDKSDSTVDAQLSAAKLLGDIKNSKAVEALVKAIEDRDVRIAAADGLVNIGGPAIGRLIEELKRQEGDNAKAVVLSQIVRNNALYPLLVNELLNFSEFEYPGLDCLIKEFGKERQSIIALLETILDQMQENKNNSVKMKRLYGLFDYVEKTAKLNRKEVEKLPNYQVIVDYDEGRRGKVFSIVEKVLAIFIPIGLLSYVLYRVLRLRKLKQAAIEKKNEEMGDGTYPQQNRFGKISQNPQGTVINLMQVNPGLVGKDQKDGRNDNYAGTVDLGNALKIARNEHVLKEITIMSEKIRDDISSNNLTPTEEINVAETAMIEGAI